VFADKLVNYDDKGWVDNAMSDLCRQEFPPELCKQVWQI
jgi:dynein heavy chain